MKKETIVGIVALIVVAGIGGKMFMSLSVADGNPVVGHPGSIAIRNSSSSSQESRFINSPRGGSIRKKQGPKKRQNKKTKRS
jgi:hypothetical protein